MQTYLVADSGSILKIDPAIATDVATKSPRRGHIVGFDGTNVTHVGTVGEPTHDADTAIATFKKSRLLARGNAVSRIVNGVRGT